MSEVSQAAERGREKRGIQMLFRGQSAGVYCLATARLLGEILQNNHISPKEIVFRKGFATAEKRKNKSFHLILKKIYMLYFPNMPISIPSNCLCTLTHFQESFFTFSFNPPLTQMRDGWAGQRIPKIRTIKQSRWHWELPDAAVCSSNTGHEGEQSHLRVGMDQGDPASSDCSWITFLGPLLCCLSAIPLHFSFICINSNGMF